VSGKLTEFIGYSLQDVSKVSNFEWSELISNRIEVEDRRKTNTGLGQVNKLQNGDARLSTRTNYSFIHKKTIVIC